MFEAEETDITSAGEKFERDPNFYIELVHFLVEGTMYRLPRYVFENNLKWFYDKHASQVPGGPPVIGSTEKNPIRLDEFGIRKAEFVSLLQVLFPRVYGADPDLTPPQWISVLRLAKMWNFENMEETAYDGLRTITQTDPVHAIQIARDFNIHDLIDPSIWVLAFRENLSITDDEHAILGPDLVQRIKQTRQNAWLQSQLYGHVYNQNTGTMIPPERDDFEGTNVIQQIEELRLH